MLTLVGGHIDLSCPSGCATAESDPKADMNAQTVTLFRGPERPGFSRRETREQADEPRWPHSR
jgi:hypothetical protein